MVRGIVRLVARVPVRVHDSVIVSVDVDVQAIAPHTTQDVEAENHEHDPHTSLERARLRFPDRDAEQQPDAAGEEQRQGVPEPPRGAAENRRAPVLVPSREGRHRGDVICFECVPNAEKESEKQEGRHVILTRYRTTVDGRDVRSRYCALLAPDRTSRENDATTGLRMHRS